MEIKLWYDNKNKINYFVGIPNCDKCLKECVKLVWYIIQWGKNQSSIIKSCVGCIESFQSDVTVMEEIPAVVVPRPPFNCQPRILRTPSLSNGKNLSLFEAALPKNTQEGCIVTGSKYFGQDPNRKIQVDFSKDNLEIRSSDCLEDWERGLLESKPMEEK